MLSDGSEMFKHDSYMVWWWLRNKDSRWFKDDCRDCAERFRGGSDQMVQRLFRDDTWMAQICFIGGSNML